MIDSARDHPTIVEVLAAFVREHAPTAPPDPNLDDEGEPLPRPSAATDVQAAVTVLGRRPVGRSERGPINLTGATLYDADLTKADLAAANLTIADLEQANLTRADLTRADLTKANLTRSHLTHANLTGASLTGVTLTNEQRTAARGLQGNVLPVEAE